MSNILNSLTEFKNTLFGKFGPIFGTVILVLCALAALSILGFLIRTFFGVACGLIIAGLVIFGIYKLSEYLKSKK